MPFTFSHPAIVLPLNRLSKRWMSLTGLVIGSLTPDFEYFIRMDNKRIFTHTWTGLVIYDLPLGILLAFIFHNIVRNPLINNSPSFLQQRLFRYKDFNWNFWFKKRWAIIILSLLIGGVSHLLWDSFTHEYGFVVKSVDALQHREHVLGFAINNFFLLQLLSSVIGGMVVIYALFQIPADQGAKVNGSIRTYWAIVLTLTLVIFIIRRLLGDNYGISDVVIPAIAAFLLALIITPVFLSRKAKV